MKYSKTAVAGLLLAVTALVAIAQDEPEFKQVSRPGSVVLADEYDTSDAQIPLNEVHTLLRRDAIPALMYPKTESVKKAGEWLDDGDRIIVVEGGVEGGVGAKGEVLGVPVRILMFHEVANVTVGGEPLAASYCPLCDSATVFSRKVQVGKEKFETLEFGISGALFNSNVLMYDREHKGLWSQIASKAVTGPMAGTMLVTKPLRIVRFDKFAAEHPKAKLVSRETGHNRPYEGDPYAGYFGSDQLMVPVKSMGDAMAKKTLGVGVSYEGDAWFVPVSAIGDGVTIETAAGPVRVVAGDAGINVLEAPEGVQTAQTYYYSWTAFYPRSEVIGAAEVEEKPKP
jgi:uncharacterized protein DUF3179